MAADIKYPKDPVACAQQLLVEHAAREGFRGTGPDEGVGSPETKAALADILKMLFASGLDMNKIISIAVKMVPLVISKNWFGIIALVIEMFTNTPIPVPTPPAPVPSGPEIKPGK
jgi:hypothetical protein